MTSFVPALRPHQKRLYINKDKYFENLDPEVWHYQIGGYQVLINISKTEKDQPSHRSPPHHPHRHRSGKNTLEIQSKIDESFPKSINYLVL